MNSKELEQRIEEFFAPEAENKISSMLIKGSWGVGKTECVLRFVRDKLNNKERKDVIYISLSGKSSIESINKELFLSARRGFRRLKKTLAVANYVGESTISVASLFFPFGAFFAPALKIIPTIDKMIDKQSNKKNKKRKVVIFDDFERISEKINILDVLGYFGALIEQNYRLIIIGNTNKFEERFEEFKINEEKYFDCTYYLSEVSPEIYNEILGIEENLNHDYYKYFNNNIRYALKTKTLYDELKEKLPDRKDYCYILGADANENPRKSNELIRVCSLIIYCDLTVFKKPETKEKTSSSNIEKAKNRIFYDDKEQTIELGESFLGETTQESHNFISNLAYAFDYLSLKSIFKTYCYMYLFMHGTIDPLREMISMKKDPSLNEYLVFSNPFFLTDSSLERFIKQIEKWIINYRGKNSDIFVDNIYNYLQGIAYKNISSIPEFLTKKIIDFVSKIDTTESMEFKFSRYLIYSKEEENLTSLIEKVVETIQIQKKDYFAFNKIKKYVENGEFNNAAELLQKNFYKQFNDEAKKQIFNDFLQEQFFIPICLNSDESRAYYLSSNSCKFLRGLGFKDELDNLIEKIKENSSDSPSKIRKLEGIKKYYEA